MSELVTNCPRCNSHRITFDVISAIHVASRYNWQRIYESFSVCRACRKSTVFFLAESGTRQAEVLREKGIASIEGAINNLVDVLGHLSLKDESARSAPKHIPDEIEAIFNEGAQCHAVGCFNAAGTMFRLCVDRATQALLPEQDESGLNARVRRSLGLRVVWLLDNGHLPEGLRELTTCLREDGNDGAHAGTLSEEDSEDLQDFCVLLLERLYTEPERLRIAAERRDRRRQP